VAQV
jgi:hypothetical protein